MQLHLSGDLRAVIRLALARDVTRLYSTRVKRRWNNSWNVISFLAEDCFCAFTKPCALEYYISADSYIVQSTDINILVYESAVFLYGKHYNYIYVKNRAITCKHWKEKCKCVLFKENEWFLRNTGFSWTRSLTILPLCRFKSYTEHRRHFLSGCQVKLLQKYRD